MVIDIDPPATRQASEMRARLLSWSPSRRMWLLPTLAATLLCACATAPDQIEPISVPPDRYLPQTCAELQVERDAVARKIAELREGIETANSITQGVTGIVAWWVLWPELLYHRAAEAPKDKAEYARLLGEHRTMTELLALKNCIEPQAPNATRASPPSSSGSGPR